MMEPLGINNPVMTTDNQFGMQYNNKMKQGDEYIYNESGSNNMMSIPVFDSQMQSTFYQNFEKVKDYLKILNL